MARILIVDDDNQFRKMMCQILRHHGFEVAEAVNGTEALQELHQQVANLVILDLIMPEKEGIETIVEIRNIFPDLKIIAISGGSVRADLTLLVAEKLGADHVLQKPFEHKLLLDTIDSLIK